MVKVRKTPKSDDVCEISLLIEKDAELVEWDDNDLVQSIINEVEIAENTAKEIAEKVKEKIKELAQTMGWQSVDSSFIREFVSNEIVSKGKKYKKKANKYNLIGLSASEINTLLESDSTGENSNLIKNPEGVNFTIAEVLLKKHALTEMFSEEVVKAHLDGQLYIHDLGSALCRAYCSGNSLEYLKLHGLKLPTVHSVSKPASNADVVVNHLLTASSALQSELSGAIGWDCINVFISPYLVGMSKKEIKQVAQKLIFGFSQLATAKGGQSLDKNEIIYVNENGKGSFVRIGKYIDEKMEEFGFYKHGKYEILDTNDKRISTISFNKEMRVGESNVKYLARMKHDGKMYEIETQNGIINVTGDHSVFCYKDGVVCKKEIKELKINEHIIVPANIKNIENYDNKINVFDYIDRKEITTGKIDYAEFSKKAKDKYGVGFAKGIEKTTRVPSVNILSCKKYGYLQLPVYEDIYGTKDYVFKLKLKGDSQAEIDKDINIDEDLAYIFGMYVSEGCKNRKKCNISNNDEKLINHIKNCLNKMNYPFYNHYPQKITSGGVLQTGVLHINGILGYLIASMCTNENGEKIIPSCILLNKKENILNSFLRGFFDGDGLKHRKTWAGSNSSEFVISGISFILLRLGKESCVFKRSYEKETWNDNYEIRERETRLVSEKDGFKKEPSALNKIYDNKCYMANKKEKAEIEKFIKSDLSLSLVRKITEYKYSDYVYDISVPETESFLGGKGAVFFKNTIFSDLNVNIGVPDHYKKSKIVGPKGKYYKVESGIDGKKLVAVEKKEDAGHYFELEEYSNEFLVCCMEILEEGDANGVPFVFPKFLVHFDKNSFNDEYKHIVNSAYSCASKNGSPYFLFDRGESVKVGQCCRLSLTLTDEEVSRASASPENNRFQALQNVTINMPRIAYKIDSNLSIKEKKDIYISELKNIIDIAIIAHKDKKKQIKKMMRKGGLMKLMANGFDGNGYASPENFTYLIGILGLNEVVQILTEKQLHESDEAYKLGLNIIAEMSLYCDKIGKENGMKIVLEESPAESASQRLAIIDLRAFDKAKYIVKGDLNTKNVYYTNSVHLVNEANVNYIERIEKQGRFHPLIKAGAITHLHVAENLPSIESIDNLINKVYTNTPTTQLTLNPEFSVCDDCNNYCLGLKVKCSKCGSSKMSQFTRIVGYFSKVQNWSKNKKEELKHRQTNFSKEF